MVKKLFPILLILLVVMAWYDIIHTGYQTPKQYNNYVQEGDSLLEEKLYVKAVEQYKNAYDLKPSAELLDKILDCYQKMGDGDSFIETCLKGISIYPKFEKFYERVLQYYATEEQEKFIEYAVKYKNSFPKNEVISDYYKQAAKITYVTGTMQEKPVILSDNTYMCYEEEYDREKEERKTFAVVKDLDGKKLFSGEYKTIRMADNGYFVQDYDGKWTMVNEKGFVIAKSEKDTISDIVGKAAGCYVVIDEGKYKLMNSEMKFAQTAYDYISNSSEGVYAICKEGKWAIVPDDVITYEGEYPYEDIKINSQGMCCINDRIVVKKSGKYGIINKEGKELLGFTQEELKAYEDKQFTVYAENGQYGYLYGDGKVFIKGSFEDALPYKNGAAAIKSNGKWGYIDQYGILIVNPKYQEVTSILSSGRALVLDEDGYWKILYIPILGKK